MVTRSRAFEQSSRKYFIVMMKFTILATRSGVSQYLPKPSIRINKRFKSFSLKKFNLLLSSKMIAISSKMIKEVNTQSNTQRYLTAVNFTDRSERNMKMSKANKENPSIEKPSSRNLRGQNFQLVLERKMSLISDRLLWEGKKTILRISSPPNY